VRASRPHHFSSADHNLGVEGLGTIKEQSMAGGSCRQATAPIV
jgi:hypothetical protein